MKFFAVAVQIVPHATLYHFGVQTSKVHMAWMRTVCGRLKSDYRLGAWAHDICYNKRQGDITDVNSFTGEISIPQDQKQLRRGCGADVAGGVSR